MSEAPSTTRAYWQNLAGQLTIPCDAFIGGRATPALSGRRRAAINPATGATLANLAECGREDVDRAVAAAREAFATGDWSRAHPTHRKEVLLRLAQLIRDHADELALLDSLDAGKRITDTAGMDIPGSAAILAWYAEATDKIYGEVAPTAPSDLAIITREPLGVVAAIVPWNYPLEMAIWKVAPALAAGNAVILKPAEEASLSALRLGELAAEAGVPDGIFNVVPGEGAVVGRALGEHPGVDVITFTGSTAVGKLFLQYAATSTMKQVWLECGGKSANLVFADCYDLDAAADAVCAGIFTNAGQVCSANSRLLIERPIREEFITKVLQRARTFQPGDPLDPATAMGPLVSADHAARVQTHIDRARGEATLLTGGSAAPGALSTFMQPTVFTDVAWDSHLARDEVFGPVLAMFAFDSDDEAIAHANESQYGLAASVWSDSLSRAHTVAARLQVGTVSVNTMDALDVTTPFGGFKESGFGRDLSLHALEKFTGLKTTWFKVGR